MLELAILGFLVDRPLHGYDLKRRVAHLTGHVRPIADGTLYPAIKRLERAGLLTRRQEPGAGAAPRQTLLLTPAGRAELQRRLAEPDELEISDENRWFTLLAFLRHLPDPVARAAVLRRRLDFLETPSSFFYDGDQPVRAEDVTDPYRQGLLLIARATSRTELRWLRETLAAEDAAAGATDAEPVAPAAPGARRTAARRSGAGATTGTDAPAGERDERPATRRSAAQRSGAGATGTGERDERPATRRTTARRPGTGRG